MENVRLNIKLLAYKWEVKKMTVFVVILFHMATSNIFHSCFSCQMFLSGAAELLTLLNALLFDTRSPASSSYLKGAIYSVKFLSGRLCNFKTNPQCFLFTASL